MLALVSVLALRTWGAGDAVVPLAFLVLGLGATLRAAADLMPDARGFRATTVVWGLIAVGAWVALFVRAIG